MSGRSGGIDGAARLGGGRRQAKAKAKATPAPLVTSAAAPSGTTSVEFSQSWGALLAALKDGRVTPWLPSAPGAGGSACGARPDLLLTVARGGEPAGFFFCRQKAPTLFEVVPLLTLTGAEAIEAGRQAVRKLFLEGPATSVFIACPDAVAGAVDFSRGAGLQLAGQRQGVTFMRLDVLAWLEAHREEFRAEGEAFRLLVFPEDTAADPLRDSVLGVCLTMARLAPDKALSAWDGFALMFALDPVEPVAATAELVIWRTRGAVVALNRITGGLILLHQSAAKAA